MLDECYICQNVHSCFRQNMASIMLSAVVTYNYLLPCLMNVIPVKDSFFILLRYDKLYIVIDCYIYTSVVASIPMLRQQILLCVRDFYTLVSTCSFNQCKKKIKEMVIVYLRARVFVEGYDVHGSKKVA